MEAAPDPPSEPPPPPEELAIEGLLDEVFSAPKQRRMHYSMKQKRDVLLATLGLGIREAARVQKIPRRTLESWLEKKEDIFAFRGSEKTLSRASGRPEIIPFKVELIAFMKDKRRESLPLTASIMAAYIRDEYSEWQEDYAAGKKDIYTAYQSLQRLLQRFAYRHGFVQRTPHGLKRT
ncbi:hypothetical protein PPTG_17423 [Phytophthora nicotianae INRA-310]|uniref:HTH psq-type domain-containing protein n=1 Tax=Phytophthora nicotianae (strain INRA-310) TaxID=761204 RepID=W2PM45_PHYN3|nr:hypothetical protein PPTG_17423 [Phytophthora nicotianae INRA-310]ETN01304.1 hypothetical protein PPTG_17423 [Phytophthora nicotianae INRA-310]